MKILFATPHLFPDVIGGSGLHSYHLIRHLAQAGHHLDVLHPYPTRHFPDFAGVEEHTLPFGRTIFDFASRVKEWIGTRHYDLGYSDGLSLLRYVRRRRFPCIFNDHGFFVFQPQYFADYLKASPKPALKDLALFWPRVWARKHCSRNSDVVVSMGGLQDDILTGVLGLPPSRTVHLPNAIEAVSDESHERRESGRDPNRFLFVGAIEFRKGMSSLLRTMARLTDLPLQFRLVGEGPMVERIRRQALPNVTLAGPKFGAQLHDEYRRAGAFVLPSLQEGMPTVLLEALGHALPVIATDVGATRVLVRPKTGLLVPPHRPAALEAAIRELAAMPMDRRAAMGAAGRTLVASQYTWPTVAQAHLGSFERTAASREQTTASMATP